MADCAHVLICGIHSPDGIDTTIGQIRQAKSRWPELRIVVLSDIVDSKLVAQAAECNVDALLSANISPDVLRGALNLVLLGQRLFPAPTSRIDDRVCPDRSLAAARSRDDSTSDFAAAAPQLPVLSEREDEILRFLASGKRNKLIAHDLGISEATVKFHIRALMRKLGVANRTQAAIFGTSRGKIADGGAKTEAIPQHSTPVKALVC